MNVNEENKKLESVVKSCKAARICSRIIFILMVVATVITLVTGIVLMTNPDKTIVFDMGEGQINKELSIGSLKIGTIKSGELEESKAKLDDSLELTSSVPALQKYFDENKDSTGLVVGVYLIGISIMCLVMAVSMWLVSSVFDIIIKEGNPFADQVPKRILISMIIFTVVVAFTTGIGFAVLLGFVTWAVYTIMDYGKTLRIQSDETL